MFLFLRLFFLYSWQKKEKQTYSTISRETGVMQITARFVFRMKTLYKLADFEYICFLTLSDHAENDDSTYLSIDSKIVKTFNP